MLIHRHASLQRFLCIAIDLRGHGQTYWPSEANRDIALEVVLSDLLELVTVLV